MAGNPGRSFYRVSKLESELFTSCVSRLDGLGEARLTAEIGEIGSRRPGTRYAHARARKLPATPPRTPDDRHGVKLHGANCYGCISIVERVEIRSLKLDQVM